MHASTLLSAALLAIALFAAPVHAQDPESRAARGPGRISGIVRIVSGEALTGASITVRGAADTVQVASAVVGRDGNFRVDGLALGEYTLRVGMIGYRPRSSEVIRLTAESPAVDLGVIVLEVAPVQLDAVNATAERSAVVVESDRTIYNTKSMAVAETGTAVDVLRAVPELEVDVNDNVKLRGNQSVSIHINGRPAPLRGEQLANFLRQLPGNRIERVEVMPNPSAKNDPEGTGGIVNIVLAEDLDLGLSGSLSANVSTRNREYINGRFNVQKGRLTLFSGAGFSIFNTESSTYDLRRNLIADPVTLIEQNGRSNDRSRGWNADWSAELKVGEQATLWTNAWIYSSGNTGDGLTEYGIMDEARTILESYDRTSDSDFTWGNYDFGLGFKQVFEPQKHELTIDGSLSRGVNDTDSNLTNAYEIVAGDPVDLPLELTLNHIDAGTGDLSLQADYFRPLAGGRLEAGYRARRRTQDNDNDLNIFESPDATEPSGGSRSGYDYAEMFNSLYTTWGRTWGKFGMQAGLRAELSHTDFDSRVGGASFEREYNTLFPSFNVSYTPEPGRSVRLLYSKRISRPSAYLLDPYVPPTDPLNRFFGNPDLEPSYTQSFTLNLSWTGKLGTIRVAPYYRRTTDVWERIRTVDTAGVATSRWENAASSKAYGSSFTLSLPPSGRVSGSTSFNLYRDIRDGTNISSAYHNSAYMWSIGGNLGVKVLPSLTAQIFANHFPTQSILQGRASGYTFTSLALRQQLWGTKGTVSLNISDPLNLFHYDSSTHDATYIQTSRSSYSMRFVTLGFTFNFGKTPERHSRRPQSEQAGETIRVR